MEANQGLQNDKVTHAEAASAAYQPDEKRYEEELRQLQRKRQHQQTVAQHINRRILPFLYVVYSLVLSGKYSQPYLFSLNHPRRGNMCWANFCDA